MRRPGEDTARCQAVSSASTVAVWTSPETAFARTGSDVTKTSAWSVVSATYSASYVVSHPSCVGDLPCLPLEHLVSEEPNLQRVDPRHPLDALGSRDLPPSGRLVERRQRLRANERRRHELVLSGDLDLAGSDLQQRLDSPRRTASF